jgi:hypothetical protein
VADVVFVGIEVTYYQQIDAVHLDYFDDDLHYEVKWNEKPWSEVLQECLPQKNLQRRIESKVVGEAMYLLWQGREQIDTLHQNDTCH